MKLLRKPIQVIAWFDYEGKLMPLKFQFISECEGDITVKIDRVIKIDMDRFAGNRMMKYDCQAYANDELKLFELRHEIDTGKWYLYKM